MRPDGAVPIRRGVALSLAGHAALGLLALSLGGERAGEGAVPELVVELAAAEAAAAPVEAVAAAEAVPPADIPPTETEAAETGPAEAVTPAAPEPPAPPVPPEQEPSPEALPEPPRPVTPPPVPPRARTKPAAPRPPVVAAPAVSPPRAVVLAAGAPVAMAPAAPAPAVAAEPAASGLALAAGVVTSQTLEEQLRTYARQVRMRIERARPRSVPVSGTVVAIFTLAADGALESAGVEPGGDGSVERVALEILRKAAPYPAAPIGATRAQRSFTLPFVFR
ncbi:Ferric siderophore transport system, periplasmic binding protein TonB [Rhodovastum atsumiense]|uniref:Energy transducer TonB n=1 Tax=Rhodovastum atsumiense TaxID=504468 RepID=A0A5M6ISA3_9PROT|nr:energy transducer TonB [Rhodovastum atsumiense]KAA5611180.1 energy transducer TonB [Rhodovastum atsumiense]CAH2602513.1 Ferric siderophore transport system, periplasmic binding protein TonB [Rhodovastum atsumiense]